ncbi:BppU family phage baseplate upper protein [Weissella paramesenteroides]|uniref:BppU family phage baseplate upper protein n=1 Tax=Weissella paramesenteroides TaxID=1249 RepID=UPI002E7B9FFC|nr:BppU family phage baseplate upper protein [Weissella paramesenteroides]WPQ69025.1 BppU family phage baseplate upper protein [Weissella paramesenteroides]
MEVMTFNIDNDRRNLVDDKQNFNIDFHDSKYNWLEARQYEEGMRQIEVHVVHGDGSPVDLTGVNPVFEGWLPEGVYRIMDAKHSVMIDAQNGIFRFDFPAQAFQVAGSYKQAFFRLMKDGKSVATLEFSLDVMADKVISGLVPSDYITPFEDLYGKLQDYITKANGDFDTAMTQWKKDVANLITNLNADVGGINLTITEIKAQLSALDGKIKADGLLTQAEFDAQIKIVNQTIADALDKLQGNIIVGDNITIGKKVNISNQSAIENIKSLVDPALFNFVFFTDCHYDQWNDPNRTGLDRLNNALLTDGSVDAIIAGGDNVDGGSALYDIVLSQHKEFINDMLLYHNGSSDKFILKGNHDDASGRPVAYLRTGDVQFAGTKPIPANDLKRMYNNSALLNGEIRNGNSNYFYKDYPEKKVRLIGLDSNDTPEVLKSDGTSKYPGLIYMGYQEEQINWLANVALQNVPENYTTVIVGHIHADAMKDSVDENNIYGDHYYNVDLVNQAINNFMRGTSSTLTSTTKDWEVSVKADFTSQGKRLMAGYIHGHQHKDNYTSDLGFNNIGITCSIGSDASNPSDDGWVVVSVDPANQTIQLRGFGHATSRSFKFINA